MAADPDPIEELVHELEPEDDPLVGTCDVYVNNRGPFRIESPAHEIAQLVNEAQEGGRDVALPGVFPDVRPQDRCRVVPSAVSDEEREQYFRDKRRFFLGSDPSLPQATLG